MKQLFTLVLLLVSTAIYAQKDCNYKIHVDTDEEKFQLTQEILTEFLVGRNQTVFIYLSLMREESVKSVVLHLSLNAMELPPKVCYNDKSRLSFALEDGSFVSVPYLGDETCGRQKQGDDTMSNSTSEASFYLDDFALEKLSGSQLKTMRITTMNQSYDINFQEVISNEQIKEPIYPKEYFLKNLKCIE
jgi:hypothetical protein